MASSGSVEGRPPPHDNVQGIGYAYNVAPPAPHGPHASHAPPHMDPGMYQPPPWGPPGYGMFPFPPPGMMMSGMPPGMPPGMAPGMAPGMIPGMAPGMPPGYGGDMTAAEPPQEHPSSMGHKAELCGSLSPPLPPTRERFSYTRYQLEMLNVIYCDIRYPNTMQKQLIAKRVGITRDQVKIWFQNRRRKDVVGKTSAKDEYLQTSVRKMVPKDVTSSVMSELMAYQNDPKGKKAKQSFNQTHDDKRRTVTARRRSDRLSSPCGSDSLSSDTMSHSSASPPMPTTIETNEIEGLFSTDNYQPNNVNYTPVEPGHVLRRDHMPSFHHHVTPHTFPDDTATLPMPTAGLATIQPVSLATDEKDSRDPACGEENLPLCGTTNRLIDIVPEDGRHDVPASTHTMTSLTPVTTDSESNDGFSSSRSTPSPAFTHAPNDGCNTETINSFMSDVDIASPPNAVVVGHPHTIVPLKRSRCDDSESEDDEEVEPPRKRQERLADNDDVSPPNTIAPPSGPIKLNPVVMIAPTSIPLSVEIPRGQESPEQVDTTSSQTCDNDQSKSSLLAPLPLLPPEPIAWPPPQWGSRPGDGRLPYYPIAARPEDTDFNPYSKDNPFMNFPPIKSTPDFMPSSYYPLPQTGAGYSWDANAMNNNTTESDMKQNCDKSLFNHLSFMSSESAKVAPYGYDSGARYPHVGSGHQELIPPWMAPLPTPYSSCGPPLAPVENTKECGNS